jgi:hypothetical protein
MQEHTVAAQRRRKAWACSGDTPVSPAGTRVRQAPILAIAARVVRDGGQFRAAVLGACGAIQPRSPSTSRHDRDRCHASRSIRPTG